MEESRSPELITGILQSEEASREEEAESRGEEEKEVELPKDPRTIYRWAQKGDWPSRPKDDEEPFAKISGIRDPILHLAKVRAHRELGEEMVKNLTPRSPIPSWAHIRTMVFHALVRDIAPPKAVYDEIIPNLRKEYITIRKSIEEGRG